jgi:hypothetical protein
METEIKRQQIPAGPGFPWLWQFRKHSWWLSPAKQRTLIIVQVWHKDDGSVEAVELLEYKTEIPVKVTVEEMITWLNTGIIEPISAYPYPE